MRKGIIALKIILFVLAAVQSPDLQVQKPAEQTVQCAPCKGTGTRDQECLQCDGTGQIACRVCSIPFDLVSPTDRMLNITDEERAKLAQSERELNSGRKQSGLMQPLKGGLAFCPAVCRGGKVLVQPADDCKYCAGKGGIACKRCGKKGYLRCPTCNGRKRVTRACEDCLGSGKYVDPATIGDQEREKCPQCGGRGAWDCRDCQDGTVVGVCPACDGLGIEYCRRCLGSGDKPCNRCFASGNLSSFHGPKTSNNCGQCGKTGRIRCDECPGKPATCSKCIGEEGVSRPCFACLGQRERPCLGCHRSAFAAWERAGDSLSAAGDTVTATAFYTIARKRADGYYDRLAAEAVEPEDSAACEKGRREACKRLDHRAGRAASAAK